MKRRSAIFLMVFGVALVLGAAGLIVSNHMRDTRASQAAVETGWKLRLAIQEQASEPTTTPAQNLPGTFDEEKVVRTEVIKVGEYSYMGILDIPALSLTLPVMDSWSYPKLRVSPCRYIGFPEDENFVILAHNYSQHFGSIYLLEDGDPIVFTDVQGSEYRYRVTLVETISATDVEAVVGTDYDLTLFTCTYGGSARVAIHAMLDKDNNSEAH